MCRLFNILAESSPDKSGGVWAGVEAFLDPVSIILCTVGMCILVGWLFWFGGFGALKKAPVRRHRWWFVFWPLSILFLWQISISVILELIAGFKDTDIKSLPESISYPVNAVVEIILIIAMLFIARKAFARQLKGFGLNLKTIHKDVCFSMVYLLAISPLIQLFLLVILVAGRLIHEGFEIPPHQTLTFLAENNSVMLTIMTVVMAAIIVPIFEEMLFRGFLQSTLRSVSTPWTAIVFTSVFFALIHWPNYTHMPSLFFLSCGFGYAYERSGSLLRPILMHILFNGISVTSTVFLSS